MAVGMEASKLAREKRVIDEYILKECLVRWINIFKDSLGRILIEGMLWSHLRVSMAFNNSGNYGIFISKAGQDRAALFKVPSELGDHEQTINKPYHNLLLVEGRSHIGMKRAIPENHSD